MKFTTTLLRYRLLSPLSSRVIASELNAQICGPDNYQHERVKRYSGVADDTSFAIRTITEGKGNRMQKSFNFIKGTINPNGSGTSIDITMDVPLFLFVIFELLFIGVTLFQIMQTGAAFTLTYLIPLLMLPLSVGVLFFLVKWEMS